MRAMLSTLQRELCAEIEQSQAFLSASGVQTFAEMEYCEGCRHHHWWVLPSISIVFRKAASIVDDEPERSLPGGSS